MERQLVLSEFPPNIRPEKWHFPMRNRIISGICSGTGYRSKEKKWIIYYCRSCIRMKEEMCYAVPGSILKLLQKEQTV